MNLKILILKIFRYVSASNALSWILKCMILLKIQTFNLLGRGRRKSTVIILSLGAVGHSYSAVRAAKRQGLRVCLVARNPTFYELIFSDDLIELDPLEDTDQIIERLSERTFDGVAISIKHILLPAQVRIAEAFGCTSCGEKSALLCNDKFEWRTTLREAGIPQPSFFDDRNAVADRTVIQKPRTGTGSKGVMVLLPHEPAQLGVLPRTDRSIGNDLYFEEMVEGDQFDVEGVSWNGDHLVLAIIREKYICINGEFPPKYFRFNPDLDENFKQAMTSSVFKILDASGVMNGGWHVEGRVRDGVFLPLDFANRMGYERYVSRASGVDFAALHLSAFVGNIQPSRDKKPVPLLQFFATTEQEKKEIISISKTYPSNIFDIRLDRFKMSTIYYNGMVVICAKDDAEMEKISRSLMQSAALR